MNNENTVRGPKSGVKSQIPNEIVTPSIALKAHNDRKRQEKWGREKNGDGGPAPDKVLDKPQHLKCPKMLDELQK